MGPASEPREGFDQQSPARAQGTPIIARPIRAQKEPREEQLGPSPRGPGPSGPGESIEARPFTVQEEP